MLAAGTESGPVVSLEPRLSVAKGEKADRKREGCGNQNRDSPSALGFVDVHLVVPLQFLLLHMDRLLHVSLSSLAGRRGGKDLPFLPRSGCASNHRDVFGSRTGHPPIGLSFLGMFFIFLAHYC